MDRNRPLERNLQARKKLESSNIPVCQSAQVDSLTWLEQDAKEVTSLIPRWALLCSTALDLPQCVFA